MNELVQCAWLADFERLVPFELDDGVELLKCWRMVEYMNLDSIFVMLVRVRASVVPLRFVVDHASLRNSESPTELMELIRAKSGARLAELFGTFW